MLCTLSSILHNASAFIIMLSQLHFIIVALELHDLSCCGHLHCIEYSIVTIIYIFLPIFGRVDTGEGWNSKVCPRTIGGISTWHKMIHSLSLPTVTYICMRELPHFHHGTTTSFLHSRPIQTHPSGCTAGQPFIWDYHSVTPLS